MLLADATSSIMQNRAQPRSQGPLSSHLEKGGKREDPGNEVEQGYLTQKHINNRWRSEICLIRSYADSLLKWKRVEITLHPHFLHFPISGDLNLI